MNINTSAFADSVVVVAHAYQNHDSENMQYKHLYENFLFA